MRSSAGNIVFTALALLILLPVQSLYPALGENTGLLGVALEAMERLTPDLTDPPVTFAIKTGAPQIGLFFEAGTEELGDVAAWQIQIFDRNGRKVSFIQGRNKPANAVIPWTGVSNSGEPLPDGFYYARFVWQDSDKQIHVSPKTSVSLFTPLEIRSLSKQKLKFEYTREGLVVRIAEGMLFTPGESKIQNGALPALREISVLLRSCSKNMVAIRGYTDSTGSPQKNLLLSRERACDVYRYLVNAGIDPDRLTYTGLGAAEPLASNTTEPGRARNRRVEVVVLKIAI